MYEKRGFGMVVLTEPVPSGTSISMDFRCTVPVTVSLRKYLNLSEAELTWI